MPPAALCTVIQRAVGDLHRVYRVGEAADTVCGQGDVVGPRSRGGTPPMSTPTSAAARAVAPLARPSGGSREGMGRPALQGHEYRSHEPHVDWSHGRDFWDPEDGPFGLSALPAHEVHWGCQSRNHDKETQR